MGYPYLFQTCGFATIDAIRAELESQRDWDRADTSEDAHTLQLQAARRFGFFDPFTREQTALAVYLTRNRAGLHIATYAWGLYAETVTEPHRQYA